MRTRLSVVGLCLAVLAGGCAEAAARAPAAAPAVPPAPPPVAADAGGVCRWLDFDVVATTLGLRFDIAAATEHGTKPKTQTCVLQATRASRPDLLLTVTPTTVDAEVFAETVRPQPARSVAGLGEAAYRVGVKAATGYGPGAEVGWLSTDGRLVTLRCTLARGGSKTTAKVMEAKLVTLAKRVETAR